MDTNKKRDIVEELKSYARRSDMDSEGGFPEWGRLNSIIAAYVEIDNLKRDSPLTTELYRHIVVSLVAVIQSVTRSTISKIVDEKELAGETIPELKSVKLTLELARELKNHSFSFGELVAHFLSVSGVDQIASSINHVSKRKFTNILKESFRTLRYVDGPTVTPEDLTRQTRESLLKMFELRNIFCHEFGFGESINATEVQEYIRATMATVSALSDFRIDYTDSIRNGKKSEDSDGPNT